MVKRITVFMFFSSLLALSMYGCGKNEPGNPQVSGQSSEQDFAKIHKNIDFNKEDKGKNAWVGNGNRRRWTWYGCSWQERKTRPQQDYCNG